MDMKLWKSVEDIPQKYGKTSYIELLKKVIEKINLLRIDGIKATKDYKKFIESEIKKYTEYKEFIENKIKEIDKKNFEKATGSKDKPKRKKRKSKKEEE